MQLEYAYLAMCNYCINILYFITINIYVSFVAFQIHANYLFPTLR